MNAAATTLPKCFIIKSLTGYKNPLWDGCYGSDIIVLYFS